MDNQIDSDKQPRFEDRSTIKDVDEIEEKLNFQRVINTFRLYSKHSSYRLNRAYKCFENIPVHHQLLLKGYKDHLDKIAISIQHNHEVLRHMIDYEDNIFDNKPSYYNQIGREEGDKSTNELKLLVGQMITEPRLKPTSVDIDKVQSVLRQIVREWSKEGKAERDQSFGPILDALERYIGKDLSKEKKGKKQILIPGAGLGRLVYEIVKCGYSCQGNEYSLYMLLPSNFIINQCTEPDLLVIYPFLHQYTNNLDCADQTRPISFPDVAPNDCILNYCEFSMAAGNFMHIYQKPDWDCVCTCFFLDTAHNLVEYIEKIHAILNDNGLWINMGPLLYHYADAGEENSIEPSYNLVKSVIENSGFEYLEEKLNVESCYTTNESSMLLSPIYKCVFFVCRKIKLSPTVKLAREEVDRDDTNKKRDDKNV